MGLVSFLVRLVKLCVHASCGLCYVDLDIAHPVKDVR